MYCTCLDSNHKSYACQLSAIQINLVIDSAILLCQYVGTEKDDSLPTAIAFFKFFYQVKTMTIQLYGIDIKLARRGKEPAIIPNSGGDLVMGCDPRNPKTTFLVPVADLPF